MTTITEDYVSFELAKLLKEKGFDGLCYKVWKSHYDSQTLVGAPCFVEGETIVNKESVDAAAMQYAYIYNLNSKVEGYLAPTLQMTIKWLRSEHKLHIQIWILEEKGYWFNIEKILNAQYKHKSLYSTGLEDIYFESYEEAYEAAIKYCLEHLI